MRYLCPFCGNDIGDEGRAGCCGEAGHAIRINTNYVYPPIPMRTCDWSAVDDNYDGAPDSHCPIGWGATEQEAVDNLMEQLS